MHKAVQMSFRVFVYGTLKTSEPNYYLMNDQTAGSCLFKGQAKTLHKYPLVIASRYNIPYVLAAEGKGQRINGEVYQVDADQLARLDQLENHPKLYERQEIDVEMINGSEKGEQLKVMAYILVKFQPSLLELTMLESYTDSIDGKKYVGPKDRDQSAMPAPLWWYEVHTEYPEPK